MVLGVLIAVVLASPPLPAGPPRVLLLPSPNTPARPGLADMVHVQLAGVAVVTEGAALVGVDISERIAEAAGLVAQSIAGLIVWPERGTSEGELLLFAVSRSRERALVQVVRIPPASEAETNRIIAVKIALLVEAGLVASPALSSRLSRVGEPPPDLRAAASTTAAAASPGGSRLPVFVEAGLATGFSRSEPQVGPLVGVGGLVARGASQGEARLALWRASDLTAARPAGQVLIDEVDISLGARLLRTGRPGAIGLWLEGGMRRLGARGVASDGATGAAVRYLPAAACGVEARWAPRRHVAVRAAFGVQISPRHRFLVDGQEILHTAPVLGLASVSFMIAAP